MTLLTFTAQSAQTLDTGQSFVLILVLWLVLFVVSIWWSVRRRRR